MKKYIRFSVIALFMTLLQVSFINMSPAPKDSSAQYINGYGLSPMTPEEIQKLSKRKIKSVKPNKMALNRVNKERSQKGLGPINLQENSDAELEIVDSQFQGEATVSGDTSASATGSAVPAQVDNSALAAFPPIGNQGGIPSCVSWGITYATMSHQVCLKLGCDNKSATNRKIFSPKFTYNMTNGGLMQGTYFSDVTAILQSHGASTIDEFPVDSNILSWDMNSDNWLRALSYRITSQSSIATGTDAGLANLKQYLANGNVVYFGTYINSWVKRTVQANPNSATNPFVGQVIAGYMNGRDGGHAMTIVGFDDSVWTDINGNGVVDAAEVGAFKVANSWGAGWGNAGFIWLSYDAFRTTSAIPGFAPAGRVYVNENGGGYVFTLEYSGLNQPKLVAKVRLSHVARNQITLQLASSSNTALNPQIYWTPANGMFAKSGAYAFNGTTTEVDGVFYYDISSLVGTNIDQQLFYLIPSDSVTGSPLTVRSFEVIDPFSRAVIFGASGMPVQVDGSNSRIYVGNYVPDLTAPTAPSNLKVSLTVKKQGKKTNYIAALSWGAAVDNSGVTPQYQVYRNGVKIAVTSSLSYSDTTTSAGVSYTYQVFAIDASLNVSVGSNSVNFSR